MRVEIEDIVRHSGNRSAAYRGRVDGTPFGRYRLIELTSRFTSLSMVTRKYHGSMKLGIAELATTLLISGGLGLASLGLGSGSAQA